MKRIQPSLVTIITALVLTLVIVGCATPSAGLQITDIWARTVNMAPTDATTPAPMGAESGGAMAQQMGAIYMNISNSGAADRLVLAESDIAQAVELHTVTAENGVMQMRPVSAIDVPANGTVQLKPGGFHVMLIGVKRQLVPGEKFNVTLTFEKAGKRQVQAELLAQ